jgi:hypothetical protein
MPKYTVTADVTISVSTVVEAHSPAKAKQLAAERSLIDLCSQCSSGDPSSEWVTSGALDGEPRRLHAEIEE